MSSGASTSDPFAKVLATARSIFERAREKIAATSRPMKVLVVTTTLAAALIIGVLSWRSTETTWAVLFSNLDREDAASVVGKLKEMKVVYRLEGDGGTIEVPQANVRELRLELAGAGLPRGGGVGFESFDKMRIGATEFEQKVLFRRALEGELARTIDTIASVQSARVHLVLTERSVFVGKGEPASASVVLKLRAGRSLGAAEVAGIVHLVSASVSGLAPDRVAVITTEGTVLHRPRREGADALASDDEHSAASRSLEATLEERVRALLDKVVATGHFDVRIAVELDRSRVERVEDRYDPKQSAVRSEQRNVERTGVDTSATGVPGAESNLPNGAAKPASSAATDAVTRESSTRNFEIDHIVEKKQLGAGTIRRLTVAVAVDGNARSKEEIERLTALVKSAVGADMARGDLVTVEAMPFVVAAPEAAPVVAPTPLDGARKYAPQAIGALAALLVSGALFAALRRKKKPVEIAGIMEAPLLETEDAEIAALEEGVDPAVLRMSAHDRAADDPATAALVLRFWLGADLESPKSVTAPSGSPIA
jgi:flagellar M-ring protein FliF